MAEWAYAQGVHVTTAYRWYREGRLPVPARKAGRRLVVAGDSEVTDDLVRDMIEVLTSFCARRSARSRTLKAVGCARRDIGPQAALKAGSTPCEGAG